MAFRQAFKTDYSIKQNFELSFLKCKIRPSVILSLLDTYANTNVEKSNNDTVPDIKPIEYGILLGNLSEGYVIDVVDCFPIVKSKDLVDTSSYEAILKLKQRVHPQCQVLGCWWTLPSPDEQVLQMSSWIMKDISTSKFVPTASLQQPLHVFVDVSLSDNRMPIKAFYRNTPALDYVFREIPVDIHTLNADKPAVSCILRDKLKAGFDSNDVLPSNAELDASNKNAISHYISTCSMKKLLELMTVAEEYVKAVIHGKIEGDPEIGRLLMKTLGSEPALDSALFDSVVQNSVDDNLMLAYLANLTQLLFSIAEKMNISLLSSWNNA